MNTNNKILTAAVVLLLMINIALVIFIVKGRKTNSRKHGKEPFAMMVKELEMTEKQQGFYKEQKEEHFKNVRPLFDSLKSAKTAFYALIKQEDVSDSTIDNFSRRISEQQAAIDKLTFAHFKRVRTIFTPEQQPKFDAFVQKMMQRGRRDSAGRK